MSDLNSCNFIGRLARDPEIRHIPSGDAVANFTIACGETWKDKQGQKQEKTEWIRAVAWRGLADVIGKYLTKGSLVFISGKMQTRQYEHEGVTKYQTEIVVKDMQMLGSKNSNSGGTGQNPSPHSTAEAEYKRQNPQSQAPSPQDDSLNDIPF